MTGTRITSILKHPSAFLPLVMSLGALATLLTFLAMHGPAPQADEGTAAHIWQILIAGQVPVVVWFAVKWMPQAPKNAAAVLFLQAGVALAAIVPVFLLGW